MSIPAPAPAEHQVQMRWRDLDGLGHVNHTVALTYMEEGRDRFLAGHGIGRDEYVVGRCAVSWLAEIEPGPGAVTVFCSISEIGRSSLTTRERILDADGKTFVEGEFGLVLWDPEQRSPRKITAAERTRLSVGESGSA